MQRADGRWVAVMSLDDGRRKSYYGKTRAEVAAKLRTALHEQERGVPICDERQTLTTFLTGWLDTIAPGLDVNTMNNHRTHVHAHILPSLGRVKLAKLTAQQVQAFYAERLAVGLSTTSVAHIHETLHKALEYAVRFDLAPRNVCKLVDAPRYRHVEMQVLSREQARALLTASEGTRLHALYTLALATGMREGELLALHWRDVDLEAARLSVRYTVKRVTGQGFVFTEPKSAKSRRQIAFPPAVADELRRHRIRQHEERLAVGGYWDDSDLVFPNTLGRPMEPQNLLYRNLRPLLARAALPAIRFHDLRHTAATLLLGARVNPKVVSEMLGHASVAITLDIYAHVLPDMQHDAAATMGAVLYG